MKWWERRGIRKGENRELVRYRAAVVSCRCGPKGLIIIYRRGGGRVRIGILVMSLYTLLPATDPPPVPPENHGIPQKPSPLPRRRQIMVPKGNRKERQLGSGEIESVSYYRSGPASNAKPVWVSHVPIEFVVSSYACFEVFFLWIFRYNTFDGRKSFKFSYSPKPFEGASPNGS